MIERPRCSLCGSRQDPNGNVALIAAGQDLYICFDCVDVLVEIKRSATRSETEFFDAGGT